jgi:tRNA A-37 threonylcarbamoyl transferase component Bud32
MEFIKSMYSDHLWELVQYKRVRSVYVLSRWGRPELYVKIYHPDSLFQKLRNLVYPKTLREMRILERLRRAGLPVPEVVEHVRDGFDSALVTRAVYPATAVGGLPEERQIRIMLGTASSLLQNGFFYKDCHAGNVVLDESGEPVLVDAYAVSPLGRITEKAVVRLFSQIASAYRVPDAVLEAFLEELLPTADLSAVVRSIRERGLLARQRLVKRRVSRSLREGSFSQEIRTANYRAFMAKEHPVDLSSVILEHGQNLVSRSHILKFQHKTQVSIVRDLCVKSYARSKPFTAPYALRSWKGLLTLLFNRIPVAYPVAVVLGRDGMSILVTGLVPGRDLNRALFHDYPSMAIKEKMEIARELGKLLGALHGYGIYHADLKASNIKLLKDPVRFVLLDTDRVCQGRCLSRKKRLRNLMQINNSIPRHVKKSVRMAFVRAYARMTGDDPQGLFRDVWNLASHEAIAYRTDDGDRTESWSLVGVRS